MNRLMMYYWGLTSIGNNVWHSNDTDLADNAALEWRYLPMNRSLTHKEQSLIMIEIGLYNSNPEWDTYMINYTTALDIVCVHWLDSCMAERCYKKALTTHEKNVTCIDWQLAQDCLNFETPFTRPHFLAQDMTNWTTKWHTLTDNLPTGHNLIQGYVITKRWWEIALGVVEFLIHFIGWCVIAAKEGKEEPKHEPFVPVRVEQYQCRNALHLFPGDYEETLTEGETTEHYGINIPYKPGARVDPTTHHSENHTVEEKKYWSDLAHLHGALMDVMQESTPALRDWYESDELQAMAEMTTAFGDAIKQNKTHITFGAHEAGNDTIVTFPEREKSTTVDKRSQSILKQDSRASTLLQPALSSDTHSAYNVAAIIGLLLCGLGLLWLYKRCQRKRGVRSSNLELAELVEVEESFDIEKATLRSKS